MRGGYSEDERTIIALKIPDTLGRDFMKTKDGVSKTEGPPEGRGP